MKRPVYNRAIARKPKPHDFIHYTSTAENGAVDVKLLISFDSGLGTAYFGREQGEVKLSILKRDRCD